MLPLLLSAVKSPVARGFPFARALAAPVRQLSSLPRVPAAAGPDVRAAAPLHGLGAAGLSRLLLAGSLNPASSFSVRVGCTSAVAAGSAPMASGRPALQQAGLARRCFSTTPRAAQPQVPPKEAPPASGEPAAAAPSLLSSPLKWWRWQAGRMKVMFTEYGFFAVAVYLGVYVITLGSLYVIVKLDLITRPDVNGWINNWRVTKIFTDKPVSVPPDFIDFATAWVLTKTTEPVRLAVVLAILPVLVRKVPPHVIAKFKRKPKTPQ